MALESKGPYEIARILASEKIERPSYYLAQRGMGKHQSNYNPAERYTMGKLSTIKQQKVSKDAGGLP